MRRTWVWWLAAAAGLALIGTYALERYQASLNAAAEVSELPAIAGYEVSEIRGHEFLKPGVKLLLAIPKSKRARGNRTFLLVEGKVRGVASLNDLAGQMRLDSCAEARDFVDSFAGLSKARWRHLTRLDSPAGQPTFLNTPGRIGAARLRANGALTPDEQAKNGLSDPEAEQTSTGFTVTEWVWSLEQAQGGFMEGDSPATTRVYQVAFHLTPDGHVREEVLRRKILAGLEFIVLAGREAGKGGGR